MNTRIYVVSPKKNIKVCKLKFVLKNVLIFLFFFSLTAIEENFKTFDKNKSNDIEKRELKACLYSLGEEKTKSEIEAIMAKFGKNGKLSLEQFKEFMIGVYGDNDHPDQINNGFKLINKGEDVAIVARLENVMEEEDIKYITENAPKKDKGYDYVAWTQSVFAR